eukprot:sb/3466000/
MPSIKAPEGVGKVVLADGPVEEQFTVNEVVERSGWGPYQQKMILVTGVISFATAAEVWLVGVILKNIKCEWGLSSSQESMVTAILFLFYSIIGSLACGYFADKYGRWIILVITIFITGVSGVACAFAPSYYFFLICRSFAGFAMGGNYVICTVYTQEMMSAAQRAKTIFLMEAFVVGGFLYTCLVALVVMDMDNGWRIQAFITAMPLLVAFLSLFFLDESLRFLVINGKVKEARKIVDKIYKLNDLRPFKGSLTVIQERKGELSDVWAAPHTFECIQLTIHWMCDNYLFFGVMLLGPNMLSDDYCGMVSWFNTTMIDDTGCDVYTNAEYWCLAVIAVAVFPGITLSQLCDWIGRRPAFTGI